MALSGRISGADDVTLAITVADAGGGAVLITAPID